MIARIVRGLALLLILGLSIPQAAAQSSLPIVFVHGNGDSAALWHTTIWRFESQGYDPARLFAVDMAAPTAPGDDTKSEENRSTSIEQAAQLAAAVTRALLATGAEKVVLVGNSRGANTIRNYVRFGGGHAHAALVILAGGVNHGVYAAPANLNSEFNGSGKLMSRLNEGSEVHPGIRFVTLRSDKFDKYAQPTGEFIGQPGKPTGVSYDAPALKGAENLVLDGLDHREIAFHARAFAAIYEAVTGKKPAAAAIATEAAPVLDGMVAGFANGAPNNLPLVGAAVEVFEIDPATGARRGCRPPRDDALRRALGAIHRQARRRLRVRRRRRRVSDPSRLPHALPALEPLCAPASEAGRRQAEGRGGRGGDDPAAGISRPWPRHLHHRRQGAGRRERGRPRRLGRGHDLPGSRKARRRGPQ